MADKRCSLLATPPTDGFAQSWNGEYVFLNPPWRDLDRVYLWCSWQNCISDHKSIRRRRRANDPDPPSHECSMHGRCFSLLSRPMFTPRLVQESELIPIPGFVPFACIYLAIHVIKVFMKPNRLSCHQVAVSTAQQGRHTGKTARKQSSSPLIARIPCLEVPCLAQNGHST